MCWHRVRGCCCGYLSLKTSTSVICLCHLAAYVVLISFSNCLFNADTKFRFNVCYNVVNQHQESHNVTTAAEAGEMQSPAPLNIVVGFKNFVQGPNVLAKEVVTYIFFGLGLSCTLLLLLGRMWVSSGTSPQFVYFPYLIYQMATVMGTFIVAAATAVIQYRSKEFHLAIFPAVLAFFLLYCWIVVLSAYKEVAHPDDDEDRPRAAKPRLESSHSGGGALSWRIRRRSNLMDLRMLRRSKSNSVNELRVESASTTATTAAGASPGAGFPFGRDIITQP